MEEEKLIVGKSYQTNYGDTVKIVERYKEDDSDGRSKTFFTGSFTKIVKGHENMLMAPNNVTRFASTGHWWPKELPVQPGKSVHDLIEEVRP